MRGLEMGTNFSYSFCSLLILTCAVLWLFNLTALNVFCVLDFGICFWENYS